MDLEKVLAEIEAARVIYEETRAQTVTPQVHDHAERHYHATLVDRAPLLLAALRLRVTGAAVLEANDSGDDDAFEDAQAAHDKALAEFEALAEGEKHG